MNSIENLRQATAEELTLRLKRASLVVLLTEIRKAEAAYYKATGRKAPSLMELIKEQL